jgi:hypothetical protein
MCSCYFRRSVKRLLPANTSLSVKRTHQCYILATPIRLLFGRLCDGYISNRRRLNLTRTHTPFSHMGLYRIPVHREKLEAIPRLMQSIGFPIVRSENQHKSVSYFCHNPKRPNKNWSFCITREKRSSHCFFTCGLSQLSKRIVGRLNVEGIFDRDSLQKEAAAMTSIVQPDHQSLKAQRI